MLTFSVADVWTARYHHVCNDSGYRNDRTLPNTNTDHGVASNRTMDAGDGLRSLPRCPKGAALGGKRQTAREPRRSPMNYILRSPRDRSGEVRHCSVHVLPPASPDSGRSRATGIEKTSVLFGTARHNKSATPSTNHRWTQFQNEE